MIEGQHPGVRLAPRGGGGPPLVLLHGFLGAPDAWSEVIAALPDHGPVWCPWLPGHGPARPQPDTFGAAAQAIANALPAGALLAGYSLGARLALAAALHRPDRARATLLVGGHVGLADAVAREERAALDAQRSAALRSGTLAAFIAEWEALPLFATQHHLPEAVQTRQRARRHLHDAQALTWAFDVAGLAQMPDLRGAIAQAQQPLCFMTGALDSRFGALAASLVRAPWVTHRIVPGAGHNLLLESPAAVAEALGALMRAARAMRDHPDS